MSRTQTSHARAARVWWLTFLTCCALTISPVIPAFGEESTPPSDDGEIVVVVDPNEEAGTGADDATGEGDPAIPDEDPADDLATGEGEGEPAGSGDDTVPADPAGAAPPDDASGGEEAGNDAAGDGTQAGSSAEEVSNPDSASGESGEAGEDSGAAAGDGNIPDPETGTGGASPKEDEPQLAGPMQDVQEMSSLVESGPETTLQLMSVEDAGLDGDAAASLTTLETSGEVTTLASALVPVHDTPENVVAVLVGSGVTYSNVGYTGATVALGTFTGGTGIIGFEDGIILGSGNIEDVVGPNDSDSTGTTNSQPGDEALSTLAAESTYDAAVLTFDFVPAGNQIVFSYVFSSEEYNEYVNEGYNDVFAFYVNGQNCAVVEGGAVSIDTINNDSNSDLYVDNEDGHLNTEMDGLTVVLTCQATVTPGVTNTMKLAIADAGDFAYDSNVFIQAKSFVVPTPTPSETPVTPSPSTTPEGTPTQVPGTPTPTEHAGKPHKPHKHYTSYKQYVDECEEPVPAVALAVTSPTGSGGMVTALPNTGAGQDTGGAHQALVIAAAIGAGVSLIGAIRTSKAARGA